MPDSFHPAITGLSRALTHPNPGIHLPPGSDSSRHAVDGRVDSPHHDVNGDYPRIYSTNVSSPIRRSVGASLLDSENLVAAGEGASRVGTNWRKSRRKQALRRRLWAAQGGLCYYCGQPMNIERLVGPVPREVGSDNDPTIDHKQPRSRGGADTSDNLVLACRRCNTLKRNRPAWAPPRPKTQAPSTDGDGNTTNSPPPITDSPS